MSHSALPDLPTELEDGLIAALDLTEDERGEALDVLCAENGAHAEALRAHAEAAARRSQADGGIPLMEAFRRAAAERAFLGSRVGPYEILERLGGGSHGDVFLAQQSEPLNRRVALKILRASPDRSGVWARFEAEQQALALLDHGAIAKIFDAGTTDDGRPWFALELVPAAMSITRFCAEERLDLRARLGLFTEVCDGVQHAHGRGILHRDLKPGNVLCARIDGRPCPKVIDFGIAKATGGRLTELPFRTLAGDPLGTPVYASPEQARGALDLDVRTDVYSLGALLHELCCAEYPFAERELASAWTEDRARFFAVVTGEEPAAPSRRLAEREGPTPWGEDAAALARECRGDIDAIVAKALARARDDRYPTVSELGGDVRRWLAGETVTARLPGVVARTTRVARRHRVAVGAGLAVSAVLVSALVVMIGLNEELRRAREEEVRSNAELRAGNDLLVESNARLRREVREAEEVRRIQRHAAASLAGSAEPVTLDEWARRLVAPMDEGTQVWTPGVESALRQTAGRILVGLGLLPEARDQLEGALALLSADDSDTRLERAATAHALADDAVAAVGEKRSRALLEEALAIYREELGEDAPETLAVGGDLAFMQAVSKNKLEALIGAGRALQIAGRVLFPDSGEGSGVKLDERIASLRERVSARLKAGDEPGARRILDELLTPVFAEPVFRARMCNVLWAASNFDQLAPVAPLLLEAAIDFGEDEHGPGHDHVMLARSHLLARLVARDVRAKDPVLEKLARCAAHAIEQMSLERAVPWAPEVYPVSGKDALAATLERARDAGFLPAHADEFLTVARESGILDDAGIDALRAELAP